jgi:hypothetical protein
MYHPQQFIIHFLLNNFYWLIFPALHNLTLRKFIGASHFSSSDPLRRLVEHLLDSLKVSDLCDYIQGKFIPEHCSCDILKDLKFMVEVDYNFNITFENFRFSLYKIDPEITSRLAELIDTAHERVFRHHWTLLKELVQSDSRVEFKIFGYEFREWFRSFLCDWLSAMYSIRGSVSKVKALLISHLEECGFTSFLASIFSALLLDFASNVFQDNIFKENSSKKRFTDSRRRNSYCPPHKQYKPEK